MGQAYFIKVQRYKQFATAFLALLLVYLLFHLFVSQRSLTSLMTLSSQQQVLQTQISEIQNQKEELQDRVARLRPETIDTDLLQEQAMKMLGKSGNDTLVIIDQQS